MKKLHNPQAAIYEFIVSYYEKNSIPPTVREICAAVGLNSTSTVHAHLAKLEQNGLIYRNPNKQRAIVIVENQEKHTQAVPLVGNVAAGAPILAVDNIMEEYQLSPRFLRGAKKGEVYMLQIEGTSMVDAGILHGDTILVHNGLQVENGDIVVARIQGERATVKRFYEDKEHNRVKLQPENASMQPIYVSYQDVEVIGKVIGLMRQY